MYSSMPLQIRQNVDSEFLITPSIPKELVNSVFDTKLAKVCQCDVEHTVLCHVNDSCPRPSRLSLFVLPEHVVWLLIIAKCTPEE